MISIDLHLFSNNGFWNWFWSENTGFIIKILRQQKFKTHFDIQIKKEFRRNKFTIEQKLNKNADCSNPNYTNE